MRRLFQSDRHADSDYDRPNLPWVCGRAEEGCACPLGPTAGGRCRDESPCQPIRSGRRRRGRLAMGLVIFAAGALAMGIGSPWRRDLLAPGPLSQSHARLIAGSENRCAACHPGGVEAAFGAVIRAPDDATHASQSALCMECHRTQIDAQHALAPHGVANERLSARREARLVRTTSHPALNDQDQPWRSDLAVDAKGNVDQVACAVCHQEHYGADHDLTEVSDARCQACHRDQYDSFAAGHPDFGLWPYVRRTRINFDHNTHANRHYATKNEAFDCATCHIDGPRGETKLLAGYEASCARCHDADITTSAAGGLAVLALPTLDREALADAGAVLGPWPAGATGDFDGELPAIAKLLLAADPQAAAAIERLGFDFSFFDIDPDPAADARDAATLAEAIRVLLDGLTRRGHEEIHERAAALAGASGAQIPPSEFAGGLPIELVDSASRSWFGTSAAPNAKASAIQIANRQPGGGWFVDDRSFSLRYVPTGHADPLLKSWITLAASLGPDQAPLREAVLAELAGSQSAGQCARCHSLEEQGGGALLVNWRAYNASGEPRSFTKFSHRPHLTQPELRDCAHCHQLAAGATPQASPYASHRPSDFVNQFEPLTKAACIECHQPKAAGESCTQCHNYHVDLSPNWNNE